MPLQTAGKGHQHPPLVLSTLNVQGLSEQMLRMLLANGPEEADNRNRSMSTWLNGNVVGITELHARDKHQRWAEESGGRFLCSALPDEKDPAGGGRDDLVGQSEEGAQGAGSYGAWGQDHLG